MENTKKIFGDKVNFCKNEYEALEGADALLIITEWSVFRTPDFDRIGEMLKSKLIFDGRNLYDTKTMSEKGFTYISIGRK